MVKAPVCGTGDRGFESHLPPHTKKALASLRPKPLSKFNIGVSSSGKTQHFDCCMRRFVEVVGTPRQAFQSTKSAARRFFRNRSERSKKSRAHRTLPRGRILKLNIGVSSSGKTQHFDCCMRRFESCHPSHQRAMKKILPKKPPILSGVSPFLRSKFLQAILQM